MNKKSVFPRNCFCSFVVYTVQGINRVKLGEYVVGEFDLTRCNPATQEEYPEVSVRIPYLHSFSLTQNYVILPLGSYLLEYCKAIGERIQSLYVFLSQSSGGIESFLVFAFENF